MTRPAPTRRLPARPVDRARRPVAGALAALLAVAGAAAGAVPALSINGVPFANYRCRDGGLVQVAWDGDAALARVGDRDTVLRYSETSFGVVYAGGPLVMTVHEEDIVLASHDDAMADGRLPGRFCAFESGG